YPDRPPPRGQLTEGASGSDAASSGLTSAARRDDRSGPPGVARGPEWSLGASERREASGRGSTEGASGSGAAPSGLTSAARREDGASERREASGRGSAEGASGSGAASSGLTSAARREDGASERREASGRGSAEVFSVGFDLDMTLVDSRPGIAAAFRRLSALTGVPIDADLAVTRLGPPLEHEIAYWYPAAEVPAAVARYRALYPDHA